MGAHTLSPPLGKCKSILVTNCTLDFSQYFLTKALLECCTTVPDSFWILSGTLEIFEICKNVENCQIVKFENHAKLLTATIVLCPHGKFPCWLPWISH